MLKSLEIKDFALIEKVKVEFLPGLNVLTGETGAGKSIIIDALSTVLGGKAGPSLIRANAEKAQIEACFAASAELLAWMKHNELLEDQVDEIIVFREISKTGSRARINGTLVNNSLVQELRDVLITIHAQHEARTLMSPQMQLSMLDALGDGAHKKLFESVKNLYSQKKDVSERLSELTVSEEERIKRLDFARFQLTELSEASLREENEDEEIAQQCKVLSNVNQLEEAALNASAIIYGGDESGNGVIDLLQKALFEIERAQRLDANLSAPGETMRSALASLEDASIQLRRYREGLDTDPETLSALEARLALITSIKRKYGPTLKEAIDKQSSLSGEIERLENSQSAIDELTAEVYRISNKLESQSQDLSERRKKMARRLQEAIEKELKDLGMERCKFEVCFEETAEVGPSGRDRAEFRIAPNPGQPLMPLSKIASGGELSRIMLAIKTIFAKADQVGTVIFDEIDTGLSGKVLQSMRDKLSNLGESHQILCITHQPIIAATARNHIQVEKEQSKSSTRVSVQMLNHEQRLKSLAAMASGEENAEIALDFARSLMNQSASQTGKMRAN